MDADTANLEWLDLVPDVIPAEMRAAVLARRAAFDRATAVENALTAAREEMRAIAVSEKPLDKLDKVIALLALERLLAELPVPPEVAPSADDELRARLVARAGNFADYAPGHPPLVAAAVRHHVAQHQRAGELPPTVSEADRGAVEAFSQVSTLSAEVVGNWNVVLANIGPRSPRSHAVAAAAGLLDRFDQLRAEVAKTRQLVDAADQARVASGQDVCPAHGEIRPLPPVAAGEHWTLEKAVNG